ncbi:MAG TPA: sulfatase/phosphatase domain-containing protein, partial [Ktedonobacteraceae bacterium]
QGPEGLYWPRLSLQRSEGPEHTKAVMCRTNEYKYVRRLYEQDELYDLRTDPHELHNRIDDPSLVAIRDQLKDRLLTFYQETSDVVPFKTDRREIRHKTNDERE